MEKYAFLVGQKLKTVKISILHKLIYRFFVILVKIPAGFILQKLAS